MRHTIRAAVSMCRSVQRRIEEESTASDAELPELVELVALAKAADDALVTAVSVLYRVHGYSWTLIGRELGITRQAARQRFAARIGPPRDPANPALSG